MTTTEALTILREARDIYSNIDHLTIIPSRSSQKRRTLDSSILIYYAFASTQVRESGFKNWRKYAWPLYHAIRIASKKYEGTSGNSLAHITDVFYHWSTPEKQMYHLITMCIEVLTNKFKQRVIASKAA